MVSLCSPNVAVLFSGRACTIAAPSNTLALKCEGVSCWKSGSMQCNSSCLVLVRRSFPCSDNADGHG